MNVAFIGLGNLGSRIAGNTVRAGFPLTVFDVRPAACAELAELGAKALPSPVDAAAAADLVEICVRDDEQVRDVLLGDQGVFAAARPGTVVAVHSTVHPDTLRDTAALAASHELQLLDVPVSGGAEGAARGDLCYMVGGPVAALERCRPVFEASASHVYHLGDIGAGTMAKLANNLICFVNNLAAAEGMFLAEKYGLDLDIFEQVVAHSSGRSRAAAKWRASRRVSGDPTNPPDRIPALMYKDLAHILDLAHRVDLPLPGAALTQQLISRITCQIPGG